MKKVLIAENAEKAQAFISTLENEYFAAVRTVIVKTNNLGVEIPDKNFLLNILNGNYEDLRSAYWKIAEPDINAFKSSSVRDQMKSTAENSLEGFIQSIPDLFSKTFEDGQNRLMNDPYFQQFLELDESGGLFISDIAREQISEMFREYLTGTKAVKVYETQQALTKSLQSFLDAASDSKMAHSASVLTLPWHFIIGCFDVEVTKDETETVVQGITFKPRPLKYE